MSSLRLHAKGLYAEGAGNAFVLLEGRHRAGRPNWLQELHKFADSDQASELAKSVAREADAAGRPCDGLLFSLPPRDPRSDLRFVVWNRDGSRAGACGNGLRCVARRAFRVRGFESGELRVETDRGLSRVRLGAAMQGARTGEVFVEIGEARIHPPKEIQLERGEPVEVHAVDVGNPQAVVLISQDPSGGITKSSSLSKALRNDRGPLLAQLGTQLQRLLPGGPNVAVGAIEGRGASLRVFERGVGETRSCGTGAVALAAVGRSLGLVQETLRVGQRGGVLTVRLEGNSWWLSGPTRIEALEKPVLLPETEFTRANPAFLG